MQNSQQDSPGEYRFKQLFELSRRLVVTLDLNEILQSTVDGITTLAGLDTAALYLIEEDALRLYNTTPPLPPQFPDELRFAARRNHPHIQKAIETAAPVYIPDVAEVLTLSEEEKTIVKLRNLRTLLFLPLITETEAMGALIVGSVELPFSITDEQKDLSHTLANFAALAVKNARLYAAGKKYAAELEQTLAERERLQEQLLQAQKMDAIGQLAGGIAHDFNNMLSGIIGTAELMLYSITDEELKTNASDIVAIGMRSAELTGKLLAFSRKGPMRTIRVDLDQIVNDVVSILRHTLSRSIEIRTDRAADQPITVGDPAQIQSALLNLAVNARDAMLEGGVLSINSGTVDLKGNSCVMGTFELRPGRYTLISVSDTGTGMDAETMTHIFEPFFTTKRVGEGTGLGLAAVYGTMKSHQGAVCVTSAPGKGTTFNLYFALYGDTAAEPENGVGEGPSALGNATLTKGGYRILVIDDEEIVVKTVVKLLQNSGFTVEAYSDSEAALSYFREHHTSVSLVLLDVIMPKQDGPAVFRAIKEVKPDQKVILSSGFSVSGTARQLLDEGASMFLPKPFCRNTLIDAVRKVLEH